MNNDVFFYEQKVLRDFKKSMIKYQNNEHVPLELYQAIVIEYSKLLNQTVHITNVSDKQGKNLNEYKNILMNKVNLDELTGLYNRRYLFTELNKRFGDCSRAATSLSALMIDIDFFKNYNDFYGHLAGDTCLKTISSALSNSIKRPTDFVARYGGEEFFMIMPHTPCEGLKVIAERILSQISDLELPHQKSPINDFVTVSIGGASISPRNGTSNISDLLNRADKALYISKSTGRNKYTIHEGVSPSSKIITDTDKE